MIVKGGEILALEGIKEIKKAEDYADSIIAKAQAESKEILKNADAQATREKAKIIDDANSEAKKILEDAARNAKEEAAPILEKGKKQTEELLNISQDKISSAVNLVIERIVKFNGNS